MNPTSPPFDVNNNNAPSTAGEIVLTEPPQPGTAYQPVNTGETLENPLPTAPPASGRPMFGNKSLIAPTIVGQSRPWVPPNKYPRLLKLVSYGAFALLVVTSVTAALLTYTHGQSKTQTASSPPRLSTASSANGLPSNSTLHLNFDTVVDRGKQLTTTGPVVIQNTAGSDLLVADTADQKIGLGASPSPTNPATLQVAGDISATTGLRIGGNLVCTASGCIPLATAVTATTPTATTTVVVSTDALTLQGHSSSFFTDAGNIITGTLDPLRLPSIVTIQGNSFNGNSELVQLTPTGALPVLNSANLTDLNASNIASGTMSDSRLSANVALLNGTGPQTFSGNNKFAGTFLAQNTTNSATAFQIQNATGNSNLFVADTVNNWIGVGTTPANALLTVGTNTAVASGGLYFGTDTDLYRAGVGQLKTDGQFYAGSDIITQGASSAFLARGASLATTVRYVTNVTGDTFDRLQVQADGKILWGPGNGGTDTDLYRYAASTLATNSDFYALTGSTNQVKIGAVGSAPGVLFGSAGDTNLYRSAASTLKTDNKFVIGDTSINALTVGGRVTGSSDIVLSGSPAGGKFLNINGSLPLGGSVGAGVISTFTATSGGVGAISRGLWTSDGVAAGINVPTRQAVFVGDASLGAGASITNNYGVYIQNVSAGTNNYGIYLEGASTATIQLASDAGTAASGIKFGSTGDVSLYRPNANELRLDAVGLSLSGANAAIYFTSTGTFKAPNQTSAANQFLLTKVSTDPQGRYLVFSDGKQTWGDGTNPQDTNLYRAAAGILATDGPLVVNNSNINTAISIGAAAGNTIGLVRNAGNLTLYATDGSTQAINFVVNGTPTIQANNANSALNVQANGSGNLNLNTTTTGTVVIGNSSGGSTLNGNSTVNGAALFKNTANSTSAFQIQTASAANLLNVDTSTTLNLITRGDIESGTTGWAAKGASTISATTTQAWQGNSSLQVATTTAANDGATYAYTFSPSTQYTLSLYAKVASGTITDVNIGRQDVSGTDIDCLTAQTLTTSWTRFSCTFTTGVTITSSNIYIKKTGVAAETFFIDGIQLQTGAAATAFNAGGALQFSGVVNSPIAFQNKADSTTAFQVQTASGSSIFTVDTTNDVITLGPASSTPVILVLGTKSTAGDPTCTNGGIYYNSNSSQFRFCQGGSWSSPSTYTAPSYVTSLPGSPTDGQEVYYIADATNQVIWHLRYHATGPTYHWEYLGGSPLTVYVSTAESVTTSAGSSGFVDLTTVGPSITLPLAGVYKASFGSQASSSGRSGGSGSNILNFTQLNIGGSMAGPAAEADTQMYDGTATAGFTEQITQAYQFTASSASTAVKMQYEIQAPYGSGSYSGTFSNRWLTITPLAVN